MVQKQKPEASSSSSSDEDPHDRGTYVHPEDGKTYRHPSSLDSAHHISHDGKVIYSKAQLAAIENAKEIERRQAKEKKPDPDEPNFGKYVPPEVEVLHVESEKPVDDVDELDVSSEVVEEETTSTVPPPRLL